MKLRYVELPPERIFNSLGIENRTAWSNLGKHIGANKWWTEEGIGLRREFARLWIKYFDEQTGHFSLLEESIKKHGLQRPVSAISGPARDKFLRKMSPARPAYFPQEQALNEIIYIQPFGGSRITIAQRLGLIVPCAVHDFSNLFPNASEITSKNFRKWFGNEYMFTSGLPHLRVRKQSHIKNSKYAAMNQHTRVAQKRASQLAIQKLGF